MTIPARPALLPLVPLYRLALGLGELRFRTGLGPVRRLRWPVISVGSLSAGGAGKTPMTIALARALTGRGLQVDVLSRGYGRRGKSALRVDPNGAAEEYGDEPLLIAREAGVPVYVAAQRYQAGLLADADRSDTPVIHLLDDGFQHRQLHRDVNILLLDENDLTAERLLPAGNLREPPSAMRRADVIAIPAGGHTASLESDLRARGFKGPVWRLRRRMEVPAIDGPVAAFCGIARPAQFFASLETAGLQLAARLAFPDHHPYTAHDLDRIQTAAQAAGARATVTTEKDRVRLGRLSERFTDLLPLQTAKLRIEIEDELSALNWLQGRFAQASALTR
ncbi:MAG TPA: tetraacyldisaccharide 4'-kinase [Terracidiphilus sp.]|nr:tetraacyldisaccharide 4'-kinase [Terracidiphilus sp.]